MKCCSRGKRCYVGIVPQPDDQFTDSTGRRYRTCETCRAKNYASLERQRRDLRLIRGGGHVPLVATSPGEPPRFAADWDERMHREWLRELIEEVRWTTRLS